MGAPLSATPDVFYEELGDRRVCIALIGPAGERLVELDIEWAGEMLKGQ